jgi:hypothetical protein
MQDFVVVVIAMPTPPNKLIRAKLDFDSYVHRFNFEVFQTQNTYLLLNHKDKYYLIPHVS